MPSTNQQDSSGFEKCRPRVSGDPYGRVSCHPDGFSRSAREPGQLAACAPSGGQSPFREMLRCYPMYEPSKPTRGGPPQKKRRLLFDAWQKYGLIVVGNVVFFALLYFIQYRPN